jgi:hypothetical protein
MKRIKVDDPDQTPPQYMDQQGKSEGGGRCLRGALVYGRAKGGGARARDPLSLLP